LYLRCIQGFAPVSCSCAKDGIAGPLIEISLYPVKDWQYEVANGDTRAGYWEWAQDARQCDSDLEGQLEVTAEVAAGGS
jgi:hypothetical protein